MPAPSDRYVFLSYARADRERSLAVADALENAGVKLWVDRRNIQGGASWGKEIVDGIKHCAALVICCTDAAMQSRNVRQEIQLAWRYERPYLPLLLDPLDFPEELLYFLEGWQWVEAHGGQQAAWLPAVLKALERLRIASPADQAGGATVTAPVAVIGEEPAGSESAGQASGPASPAAGAGPAGDPSGAGGPHLLPRPPAAHNALDRLGAGAFVGREKELATLRTALDDAAAGHGRLVLLAGEPGIGKTRMAEELAAAAQAQSFEVLWGRCWEGEGAPPFWPWAEAFRAGVRGSEPDQLAADMGAGLADVAQIVPELRTLVPGAVFTEPPADPEQARFRLFTAVADFLRARSNRRPLLLVLDDLHWANRASLLLLQFLAERLAGTRLLVVGTYRDVELDRRHPLADALAALRRERLHERLLLQGLAPAEVAALVAGVAGQELGPGGQALAEVLHRETEGNPFFLHETLRHLVESGKLVHRDGRWQSTVASIADLGIPEGVREAVGRRLSRLSDETNRLLTIAAVIGREFPVRVVEQVAGMGEDAADAGLAEAEAARLIAELPGAPGRYRFSHALVRETLYDELPARRRVRLHRQVGEALERLYARGIDLHIAELAYHFLQAATGGEVEKAVDYALRAGTAARAAYGWEEAAALWQAALEVLDEEGPETAPELRVELLDRLGTLQCEVGIDAARGVICLERAILLYEQLGQPDQAALCHLRAGQAQSLHVGLAVLDLPRALAHFRAAEAILAGEPEHPALGRVYLGLSRLALRGAQVAEALDAAIRAVGIAERLGDEALWAEATVIQGWALVGAGRLAEGQALMERAWLSLDRLDLLFPAFIVTAWQATIRSYLLRDPADGRALLARELTKPRMMRAAGVRTVMQVHWRWSHLLLGERTDVAEVEFVSFALLTPLFKAWWSGDFAAWAIALSAILEVWRHLGDMWSFANLVLGLIWVDTLNALGPLNETHAVALAGGHVLCELRARADLAAIAARSGDVAEAEAHLQRCREIVANGEDWRGAAGHVALAEATLDAATGDEARAERHFAAAVDVFQRYHTPWDEAETCFRWAEALAATGRSAEALAHLDEATSIYQRIGAGEGWLERVVAARTRITEPGGE